MNLKQKNILYRYSNITSGNLYLINMPMSIFPNHLLIYGKVKFEDVFKIFIQKKIIVIGVYRQGDLISNENISGDNKISYNVKNKKIQMKFFNYVVITPEEDF